MYIESSDHACPHLRTQSRSVAEAVPAAPARPTECPFTLAGTREASGHAAVAQGGIGGWWAYCAEAGTAEARV